MVHAQAAKRAPRDLLIKGGTIVDSLGVRRGDIAVGRDGRIVAVGVNLEGQADVLDASDCFVAPGLVDLHCHLRQPGDDEAESVETGSRAAALGGFTAVVAMPNTEPPVDNAAMVHEVRALARNALCDIFPAGAITVGRRGERLAPIGEMAEAGVRLFTDDGRGVQDGGLLRNALEYASSFQAVIAEHCEEESLSAGGHMNEGEWSSRLGLEGMPSEAEEIMVARDIALLRLALRRCDAKLHLMHLSTRRAIAYVRSAKAEGLEITAEVTPHHFTLTDAEVASFDPVYKTNPPLRSRMDVVAVRAGLADGTVDAIATDHAPHPRERKEVPFAEAAFGVIGLQTALPLALTELPMPVENIIASLSWKAADIARIPLTHGGPLEVGFPANLCVFDPSARWVVQAQAFASRSKNSPYIGRELRGRVRHTLLWGEPVVVDGEAQR